jgi:hypothetical protein
MKTIVVGWTANSFPDDRNYASVVEAGNNEFLGAAFQW